MRPRYGSDHQCGWDNHHGDAWSKILVGIGWGTTIVVTVSEQKAKGFFFCHPEWFCGITTKRKDVLQNWLCWLRQHNAGIQGGNGRYKIMNNIKTWNEDNTFQVCKWLPGSVVEPNSRRIMGREKGGGRNTIKENAISTKVDDIWQNSSWKRSLTGLGRKRSNLMKKHGLLKMPCTTRQLLN